METWTDLVNAAFDVMGEPEIADIEAGEFGLGKLGRRAQRRYLSDARYVLRQRRWPWVETGVAMNVDSTGVFPGYQRVVTLPADCVRVNAVYAGGPSTVDQLGLFERPRVDWRRIGGGVGLGGRIAVMSETTVTVFYNLLPAQPGQMGPELFDAIAHRLAHQLSKAQSESGAERDRLYKEFTQSYKAARAAASAEGDPHELNRRRSNWLDQHRSGTV